MTRTFFLTEDQIIEEYGSPDEETLNLFWDLIGKFGASLRELDGLRTTFGWRDIGGNVPMHLNMNRVTDKENYDPGLMMQVPGTDIHVRTRELFPTNTASWLPAGHRGGGTPHRANVP